MNEKNNDPVSAFEDLDRIIQNGIESGRFDKSTTVKIGELPHGDGKGGKVFACKVVHGLRQWKGVGAKRSEAVRIVVDQLNKERKER
jgi:hypothetical protein